MDLALLWLWCKPAAAAPIQPLAWELPYATGVALKKKKKKESIFFPYVHETSTNIDHILDHKESLNDFKFRVCSMATTEFE